MKKDLILTLAIIAIVSGIIIYFGWIRKKKQAEAAAPVPVNDPGERTDYPLTGKALETFPKDSDNPLILENDYYTVKGEAGDSYMIAAPGMGANFFQVPKTLIKIIE